MLIEKVVDKIQEILGDNYAVYDGNMFASKYVDELKNDINWQAFDKDKGKIIVNFTMLPAEYGIAEFLSYNTTYNIEFWTPVEFKVGLNGELLEEVVDVWSDYHNLRKQLSGLTQLTQDIIEDDVVVKNGLNMLMSFGELVKGTAIDRTAQRKKNVLSASGGINISDNKELGNERKIKLSLDNTNFYEMKGVNNFSSGNERDGVSTQKVGNYRFETDVESELTSITFEYENYRDYSNPLLKKFEKIAYGGTDENYFEIYVEIYKGHDKLAEWKGMLNVTLLNSNGNYGVDTLQIQIVRSE